MSYEKFSFCHHQESLTSKKIPLLEALGPSHSSLSKGSQHEVVCLNNNRSQQWANHGMKLSGWLLTILNTLLVPFLSDPAFSLDWVSDSDAKPYVNLSIHQPVYLSFHSSTPVLFIICLSVTILPQWPRWFCFSQGTCGLPAFPSPTMHAGESHSPARFGPPVAIVSPCGLVCDSLDLGEGGHSSILAPFLPVTWSSSSGHTLSSLMPCFRWPGEKAFGSLYV